MAVDDADNERGDQKESKCEMRSKLYKTVEKLRSVLLLLFLPLMLQFHF